MKLIIAEKPVLGRTIAEAISGTEKTKDGCIYKGDYVITWVFGHMLQLKEPEDYDEGYSKWNTDVLPIYFPDWELKVGKDTASGPNSISKASRIKQIGELVKQAEYVIHAGDPDDEGQLLIDELLRWLKYKGTVKRLNTGNLTKEALRKALNNLTDNKEHEVYGWSAYARSVSDFMVGINMSRLFTCKNNTMLTVGRVQTPTLGLVVNRDMQIENYVKQIYYAIDGIMTIEDKAVPVKYVPVDDEINIIDKHILSKDLAEKIADSLRGQTVYNVKVTKKTVTEAPPLPFNLAKLQTYCGTHFKYSPQQVLDITQELRDDYKAITYNRSDCQYLPEDEFKDAAKLLDTISKNINYRPQGLDTSKMPKCYNTSKLTAHTAIIPTDVNVDIKKLTEAQRNVYLAICKYFFAQFLPAAEKERTNLKAELGNGATIEAVSTVILKPGYRAIFKEAEKEEISPLSDIPAGVYTGSLTEVHVAEKETKPPSRYTQTTLNEDMTRISRYVTDENIKNLLLDKDKDKGDNEKGSIGTPATRASIITELIKRGYLKEEGRKLISTPLGRELYRILPDEIKKADMTAQWWAYQSDIQEGKRDYNELINNVLATVTNIVKNADKYPKVDTAVIPSRNGAKRAVLGKCPICGGDIVEGKMAYGCVNWKQGCQFKIWKTTKYPPLANKKISASAVKNWLAGKPQKYKLKSAKTGKPYEALIYTDINRNTVSFRMEFPQKK